MNEKEKMLNGELYDAHKDEELIGKFRKTKELCHEYNSLNPSNREKRKEVLEKMMDTGKDANTLVDELGMTQISNEDEIREIILIMLFSSYQTIDEDGYKNILEQIDNHINKAIKHQEQITPELFDEFFENERKKALETMLDESDEELVWVDWDEDEYNKSK